MAKVYICDSCGKTIKNPYEVKMKEFYLDYDFDLELGLGTLVNRTSKKKIHLCDDCFKNLSSLRNKQ